MAGTVVVLFVLCLSTVRALYEDQVGSIDWYVFLGRIFFSGCAQWILYVAFVGAHVLE